MARENQGLQISLIVFVMLTIIFGVVSFVCYRSYTDQVAKAEAETKAGNEAKASLLKANDEIGNLRRYIGASTTEPMDNITLQFDKEMKGYLGENAPAGLTAVPQADRTYRKAAEYLAQAYQKKSGEQEAELNSNRILTAKFAEREKLSQAQIDKFKKAADDASAELTKTRDAYNQTRANIEKQQGELLVRVQAAEKSKADVQAQTAAQVTALQERIRIMTGLHEKNVQLVENLQKQTFDVANGKIEWVNQREKAVWINVGAADYLNRLMTFSVYDSTATDMSRAEKKATIEITQILGPHLATARIVEENIAGNPILPGDLIYTPIWRPGQQRHFALAGFIDIDKDGKSDLDKVLQLIQLNGGVVDVYYDESGKIHPEGTISDINKLITGSDQRRDPGAAPDGSDRQDEQTGLRRLPGNHEGRGPLCRQVNLRGRLPQPGRL